MIALILAAGQWLGVFVFAFCACLVIRRAAEEIRNVPRSLTPLTFHDWDASDRLERNAHHHADSL